MKSKRINVLILLIILVSLNIIVNTNRKRNMSVFSSVSNLDESREYLDDEVKDSGRGVFVSRPGDFSNEQWQAGTTEAIIWVESPVSIPVILIEINKNGVRRYSYERSIGSSFNWQIPEDAEVGWGWQIRVCDRYNYNTYYDYSGHFYIYNTNPDALTITLPTDGYKWNAGVSQYIKWTADGHITNVNLSLYKSGNYVQNIGISSNNGRFLWAPPTSLESSDDYQIKITKAGDSSVYDFSDNFEIVSPKSLGITTPSISSTWEKNIIENIQWTSTGGINKIDIELYKNGLWEKSLINETDNDGTYGWWIPYSLEDNESYQIKIIDHDNISIYDFSNQFEIFDKTISIITPSLGNSWGKEISQTILWSWRGSITNADIKLYKSDEWIKNITINTGNDGLFDWYIPYTLEDGINYQIKIFDHDNSSIYDKSDFFEIIDKIAPIITVYSPNQSNIVGRIAPEFNIKIEESSLNSTWYSIDGGITNIIFTENETIDQDLWNYLDNGTVTIVFYANDTSGNIGYKEITIRIDIENPILTIYNPELNYLYGIDAPEFDLLIDEANLDTSWYYLVNSTDLLDYTLNTTFDYMADSAILQDVWDELGNGTILIYFYANDTAGNIGFEQVIVRKDVTSPQIVINNPKQDLVFGATAPKFNITLVESNLNETWYTINGVTTNYFFKELNQSINQTIWNNLANGEVIIRFWANDTTGNTGWSEIKINKFFIPIRESVGSDNDKGKDVGINALLPIIIGIAVSVASGTVGVVFFLNKKKHLRKIVE